MPPTSGQNGKSLKAQRTSVHGGFHERLDANLTPVATGRKRLMVQARQLYVLSHAAVLGDRSGASAADQGYAFPAPDIPRPIAGRLALRGYG